jgi:hypothetical protein
VCRGKHRKSKTASEGIVESPHGFRSQVTEAIDKVASKVDACALQISVSVQGGKEAFVCASLKDMKALLPASLVMPFPSEVLLGLKQGLPVFIRLEGTTEGKLEATVFEEDYFSHKPVTKMIRALVSKVVVALGQQTR